MEGLFAASSAASLAEVGTLGLWTTELPRFGTRAESDTPRTPHAEHRMITFSPLILLMPLIFGTRSDTEPTMRFNLNHRELFGLYFVTLVGRRRFAEVMEQLQFPEPSRAQF